MVLANCVFRGKIKKYETTKIVIEVLTAKVSFHAV